MPKVESGPGTCNDEANQNMKSSAHQESHSSSRYWFGSYCLDTGAGVLRANDGIIELRPKSLEVLAYLARNSGQVVDRNEILDAVWGDATVSPNSVDQCISEIRRVLGDDDHSLLRTVPRRGILFDGENLVAEDECDTPAYRPRLIRPVAMGAVAVASVFVALLVPALLAGVIDTGGTGDETQSSGPETSIEVGEVVVAAPDREPASAEAFDRYLEGLYFLRLLENGGTPWPDEAVNILQESVQADPDWAPSRAALGRALHFGARPGGSDKARFEEARIHLEKSLQLDPGLGVAYASLGYVNMQHDRDFLEAARNLQLAVANGYPAHWEQAILYSLTGRIDESVAHYRKAVPMYPQSKNLRWQFATALLCIGRFEESERNFRSITNINGTSPVKGPLAYIAARTGRTADARKLLDEYVEHPNGMSRGPILALLGERDAAEAALAGIEEDPRWRPVQHLRTTQALGEPLRSLDYLEAAARSDPESMQFIQCPEALGAVANHPRYVELIENSVFYSPQKIFAAN